MTRTDETGFGTGAGTLRLRKSNGPKGPENRGFKTQTHPRTDGPLPFTGGRGGRWCPSGGRGRRSENRPCGGVCVTLRV